MFDVSEIAVSKGIIHTWNSFHLPRDRKKKGNRSGQFVVNRGKKSSRGSNQDGVETSRRQGMSRMETLQEALEGNGGENCDGRWLHIALNILQRNCIAARSFLFSYARTIGKRKRKIS